MKKLAFVLFVLLTFLGQSASGQCTSCGTPNTFSYTAVHGRICVYQRDYFAWGTNPVITGGSGGSISIDISGSVQGTPMIDIRGDSSFTLGRISIRNTTTVAC